MTTMLEKAALAMWKEIAHIEEPDLGDFEAGLRAALLAIREPDQALCEIAAESANEARDDDVGFFCTRAMYRNGHHALIDAILNEKPET